MPPTMAASRSQRVSSTSSLRMFWTVLKPISGSKSPNAISAVSPVRRNASPSAGRAASAMSDFFDIGAAKNALRQEDHDDGKNRERGNVLVGGAVRHILRPQD